MSIESGGGLAGLAVAAQALSQIQSSVAESAARLASAASPEGGDTLDLSAEMLALMQARIQSGVVTQVAKSMDELAGQTLSILA